MKKLYKKLILCVLAAPMTLLCESKLEALKNTINLPNRMSQAVGDWMEVGCGDQERVRIDSNGATMLKKDFIRLMKSVCSPQVLLAMISASSGRNWLEGENFAVMSYSALDTYNEMTATEKVAATTTDGFIVAKELSVLPKSRSILLGNLGSLALGYKTNSYQFQLIARTIARMISGYDIYKSIRDEQKEVVDKALAGMGDQSDAMNKEIKSSMRWSAVRRALCLSGAELIMGSLLKIPAEGLMNVFQIRRDPNLFNLYSYMRIMNYIAPSVLGAAYSAAESKYLTRQITSCKTKYDRIAKREREKKAQSSQDNAPSPTPSDPDSSAVILFATPGASEQGPQKTALQKYEDTSIFNFETPKGTAELGHDAANAAMLASRLAQAVSVLSGSSIN